MNPPNQVVFIQKKYYSVLANQRRTIDMNSKKDLANFKDHYKIGLVPLCKRT